MKLATVLLLLVACAFVADAGKLRLLNVARRVLDFEKTTDFTIDHLGRRKVTLLSGMKDHVLFNEGVVVGDSQSHNVTGAIRYSQTSTGVFDLEAWVQGQWLSLTKPNVRKLLKKFETTSGCTPTAIGSPNRNCQDFTAVRGAPLSRIIESKLIRVDGVKDPYVFITRLDPGTEPAAGKNPTRISSSQPPAMSTCPGGDCSKAGAGVGLQFNVISNAVVGVVDVATTPNSKVARLIALKITTNLLEFRTINLATIATACVAGQCGTEIVTTAAPAPAPGIVVNTIGVNVGIDYNFNQLFVANPLLTVIAGESHIIYYDNLARTYNYVFCTVGLVCQRSALPLPAGVAQIIPIRPNGRLNYGLHYLLRKNESLATDTTFTFVSAARTSQTDAGSIYTWDCTGAVGTPRTCVARAFSTFTSRPLVGGDRTGIFLPRPGIADFTVRFDSAGLLFGVVGFVHVTETPFAWSYHTFSCATAMCTFTAAANRALLHSGHADQHGDLIPFTSAIEERATKKVVAVSLAASAIDANFASTQPRFLSTSPYVFNCTNNTCEAASLLTTSKFHGQGEGALNLEFLPSPSETLVVTTFPAWGRNRNIAVSQFFTKGALGPGGHSCDGTQSGRILNSDDRVYVCSRVQVKDELYPQSGLYSWVDILGDQSHHTLARPTMRIGVTVPR